MAFLDKTGLERLWEHIVSLVGTKVEKENGKSLSTNDFTTEEKEKLAGINLDEIQSSIDETKSYTDNAVTAVKNDLLNGAGEAYDTLKELGELIDENQDAISALETIASGKSDKGHNHAISDVTNLQTTLDEITAVANESDIFVVTVTQNADNTFSSNKTHAEIQEAYNNGKLPICVKGSIIHQFVSFGDSDCCFQRVKATNKGAGSDSIYIFPSGRVGVATGTFDLNQITNVLSVSELTTTNKTITGAINELNTEIGSHNHNDLYYTETEVDTKLEAVNTLISGKADSGHIHSISEVTNLQTTLDGKVPASRTINGKALSSNITLSASDVGAYSVEEINGFMNNFMESIPKEIMYVVATVNNDGSVTMNKTIGEISQAALNMIAVYAIGELQGAVYVLPLVALVPNSFVQFALTANGESAVITANASGATFERSMLITQADVDQAEADANTYTDGKIATLLNNSSTAVDSIMELAQAMADHEEVTEALETAIGNKADKTHAHDDRYYTETEIDSKISTINTAIGNKADSTHTHSISEVTNLQTALDAKMTKADPTGTGSLSMNRMTGSTIGTNSVALGNNTTASGYSAHAEGGSTIASGTNSHAEGGSTIASGNHAHAEGYYTAAFGQSSHAEGAGNNELPNTITSSSTNDEIIAAWETTKFLLAKGRNSHAEGYNTLALGIRSHAEGYNTIASGENAHAEGGATQASGVYSHAEGYNTIASDTAAHAEGEATQASGGYSHAEGYNTIAKGNYSHAEGLYSIANSHSSHAEGCYAEAKGNTSHAEGYYTLASSHYQHVQGKYNIEDTSGTYAHIVGNGNSSSSRSNAHTLDWNGNAWFAGDIYLGGTAQGTGSTKLIKSTLVRTETTPTSNDTITWMYE